VVREFIVAESAKRGAEHKAFNKMFAWVKANAKREKIKAILSHKLDRVCRNMRDARFACRSSKILAVFN